MCKTNLSIRSTYHNIICKIEYVLKYKTYHKVFEFFFTDNVYDFKTRDLLFEEKLSELSMYSVKRQDFHHFKTERSIMGIMFTRTLTEAELFRQVTLPSIRSYREFLESFSEFLYFGGVYLLKLIYEVL